MNSALSVKHWAAVSVATSGGGGGGVKRSERVIRVNWTKHHHMWPGRRFWEEGWVTYQRRCHSRVLTSNLLMCLPSTSNSNKPHPEQSESTSCSRQQQAGAASDIIPSRWAFPQQVPSNSTELYLLLLQRRYRAAVFVSYLLISSVCLSLVLWGQSCFSLLWVYMKLQGKLI